MRAAVLLLTGCSLKAGNPRPTDESRPEEDPWGPPALQVTPDAVDFGVVDVGDRVSTSIELANVGGDDLVLNELRLAYEESSIELARDWGDILPAGASVELSIAWSPDDEWGVESKLRIGSNDPVAPIVAVWLTGVTPTPRIEVEPSAVDFGDVPVGKVVDEMISIANVGYADLGIGSISLQGSSDLQMDPVATPLVLPPGELVHVRISYTPTQDRPDSAVLMLESDDPLRPMALAAFEGRGVDSVDTGT